MRRRSYWLARAMPAGLLALAGLVGSAPAQEPSDPLPGPASDTRTVALLDAQRDGQITVAARGQGADRVQVEIHNQTPGRLNVVLPAGLVAAAATAQGFQSMGLGVPTEHPGAFGEFRGGPGFRSLAVDGPVRGALVSVPAGESIDFEMPAVCLDFGLPTPTPRDSFHLIDVAEHTTDIRAQKALRSLATLGTSQKVAQAVAWNVFNGMTFPQLAARAAKVLNPHEIALASRFVETLDQAGTGDVVDPVYLQQGRVFVRLSGDDAAGSDARRLAAEFEAQPLFGLPVRVVDEVPDAEAGPTALFLDVALGSSRADQAIGRLTVRSRSVDQTGWLSLGTLGLPLEGSLEALEPAALAEAIDRTVAGAFVRTEVIRRAPGRTTLALENRLPLSIAALTVRTGGSEVGGTVEVPGLGLGPARKTITTIPAATGRVERIACNGL